MNRVTLYLYKHDCQTPQYMIAYADSAGRIVDSPLTSRTFPPDGFLDLRTFDPAVPVAERTPMRFLAEKDGFDRPLPVERYQAVADATENYLRGIRVQSNSKRWSHEIHRKTNTRDYDRALMAKNAVERELAPAATRAQMADSELHAAVQTGRGMGEASQEFVAAASDYYKDLNQVVGYENIEVIAEDRRLKDVRSHTATKDAQYQRAGYSRLYHPDTGLLRPNAERPTADKLPRYIGDLFAAGQNVTAYPVADSPLDKNPVIQAFEDNTIEATVSKYNRRMKAEHPVNAEYHMLYTNRQTGDVYTYFGTQVHSGQYFKSAAERGELMAVVLQDYQPRMDKSLAADKSVDLKQVSEEDARERIRGLLTKASGDSIPSNEPYGMDISGVPLLDYLTTGVEAFTNRGTDDARVFLKDWSGEDTLDETARTKVYAESVPVAKALTAIRNSTGGKGELAGIADTLARECMEAKSGHYDLETALAMDRESPAQRGFDAGAGRVPATDQRDTAPAQDSIGRTAMRQLTRVSDTTPNVYGRLNRDKTLKPEITAVKLMELRNEANKEAAATGLSGDMLKEKSDALYKEKVQATTAKLTELLANARAYEDVIASFGLGHIEQGSNAMCVDLKAQHTAAIYGYGRLGGVIGPNAAVVSGCGPLAIAQASSSYNRISISETIKADVVRSLTRREEIKRAVNAALPGITADAERLADSEGLTGKVREERIQGYVENRKATIRASFPKIDLGILHLFKPGLKTTDENGQPMQLDRYSSMARNLMRMRLGVGVAAALIVAPVFPLVTIIALAGPVIDGFVGGALAVEAGKRLERDIDKRFGKTDTGADGGQKDVTAHGNNDLVNGNGGASTEPSTDAASDNPATKDASDNPATKDAASDASATKDSAEEWESVVSPWPRTATVDGAATKDAGETRDAFVQPLPQDAVNENGLSDAGVADADAADANPQDGFVPDEEAMTAQEREAAEAILASIPEDEGYSTLGAYETDPRDYEAAVREAVEEVLRRPSATSHAAASDTGSAAAGEGSRREVDNEHSSAAGSVTATSPKTEAYPAVDDGSELPDWDMVPDASDSPLADTLEAQPMDAGTAEPRSMDADTPASDDHGQGFSSLRTALDSAPEAREVAADEAAIEADAAQDAQAASEGEAAREFAESTESRVPDTISEGKPEEAGAAAPSADRYDVVPDIEGEDTASKRQPAKEVPDVISGNAHPTEKNQKRKQISNSVAAYVDTTALDSQGLEIVLDLCSFLNPMSADAAEVAKALVDTVMDGVDASAAIHTPDGAKPALEDAAHLIKDASVIMDAGASNAASAIGGEWNGKGEILSTAQELFTARLPEWCDDRFDAAFSVDRRYVEIPTEIGNLFLGEDGLLYTSSEAAELGLEEGLGEFLNGGQLATATEAIVVSMDDIQTFHDTVADIVQTVAENRGYDVDTFLASDEGKAVANNIIADLADEWTRTPESDTADDSFKDALIQEYSVPMANDDVVADNDVARAAEAAAKAAATDVASCPTTDAASYPATASETPQTAVTDAPDVESAQGNAFEHAQAPVDTQTPTHGDIQAEAGMGKAMDAEELYDSFVDHMDDIYTPN